MVMAQLGGKLAEGDWVTSEDMLTGMVLGAIKNLHPGLGADVFRRIVPLDGTAGPRLSGPLKWSFWPGWECCEPDVVVEDEANVCVVEAKLLSDFGQGIAEERQLAREWREGWRRARRSSKQLWLIALTNHGSLPREAIRHQLEGIRADLTHVGWLGWFDVGRALRDAPDEYVGGWRRDLLEVMARAGVAPYGGVVSIAERLTEIPLGDILWVADRVLPPDTSVTPDFGATFECVLALDASGIERWRLRLPLSMPTVGFEGCIAATERLVTWRWLEWPFKLNP